MLKIPPFPLGYAAPGGGQQKYTPVSLQLQMVPLPWGYKHLAICRIFIINAQQSEGSPVMDQGTAAL